MRYFLLSLLFLTSPARADPPIIEGVNVQQQGETWAFSVTLRHNDSGWEDYADGWRIEDETGKILGLRVLYHPHVNEQPFTRSLSGVTIPQGVDVVYIRAKTLTEGWDDARFEVKF